MKKQISIAFFGGVCVAAVIAVGLLASSSRQVRNRETAVKALTQQVDYLSQTVVALRKELSDLRERQRVAGAAAASAKALPPPADGLSGAPTTRLVPNGTPPAGQPFEFNGRTYYLTPLESPAVGHPVVAK